LLPDISGIISSILVCKQTRKRLNKMKKEIAIYLLLILTILFLNPSAFSQPKANWNTLFNGKDLTGWKLVGSAGVAEVRESAINCHMTANTTEHTFVCTRDKFKDFILEMEIKTDPEFNTGILLRCIDKPFNCDSCKVSLYGYQVKIDPSVTRAWTGGIFDDYGATWHWLYDLSKDDRARKAYHIGEWNHFRIEAVGPSIKVWVNGIPVTNMINYKYSKGYIALKIHALKNFPEKEKMTGKFRNIHIITKNLKRNLMKMDLPAREVN
jgi:hypothetical protein